jgi:hypothetical protein
MKVNPTPASPTPASPETFLPDCGPKLVATRLPPDLAREVEAAAARELLSVSSYCRRAIADAVRGRSSRRRRTTCQAISEAPVSTSHLIASR